MKADPFVIDEKHESLIRPKDMLRERADKQ